MGYIHLFQTNAEFLSAYNGSDYVEPWVSYTMETSGISFNKKQSQPLTIEVISGSGEITLNKTTIKYKLNDGDWEDADGAFPSISILSGDIVQLKQDYEVQAGSNEYTPLITESDVSNDFEYAIYGNIMSIYQENDFENLLEFTGEETSVFSNLFGYCQHLVSAKELKLPATALTDSCYCWMFRECYSLVNAPELPATTLADYCYEHMFYSCTTLTTAPELPATTLTINCYSRMFKYCTSLTTAPELPATTLADYCYSIMFSDCTSLTSAPALPATILANFCYSQMFQGCTGLITAPELPATTLADYCYQFMFSDCSSLTAAPELPATTLTTNCYYSMFHSCTNLNYIKCLATDISATSCTNNWVYGVQTNSGTFITPQSTNWTTGVNGIPYNWTRENAN